MKDIKGILEKLNGRGAVIRISHKLFGTQEIETELDFIFDENRVGFRVGNGQEI